MIVRNLGLFLARAFSTTARCHEQEDCKRLLRVAIVGAPNAGKSTLLNRLIQSDVSCVSSKVHTTRKNVFGVHTQGKTQLEFYDSPGVVARQHLLKHNLETSLLVDPKEAAQKCDLIAVLIDASNIREQRRLNRGVLSILAEHQDKRSILIMNKVDLVKDKRQLLDMATRLTQGCLNGRLTISKSKIYQMSDADVRLLNLSAHLPHSTPHNRLAGARLNRKHKFVIELETKNGKKHSETTSLQDPTIFDPDSISFKYFSEIFSISAMHDDKVDDLRDYMSRLAKPVERFPHSPDYLTDQSARDIVLSIIRGKFMDLSPSSVPYTLIYDFQQFESDNMGSLHVNLLVICPSKYAISQVIGEKGCVITRVISESRDLISRTLGCDVKLTFNVDLDNAVKNRQAERKN